MRTVRYAALVAVAFIPGWVRQHSYERAQRVWRDQLLYELRRYQQGVEKEVQAWAADSARKIERAFRAGAR